MPIVVVRTRLHPANDWHGTRISVTSAAVDQRHKSYVVPFFNGLTVEENHISAAVDYARDRLGLETVVRSIANRASAPGYVFTLSTYTVTMPDYSIERITAENVEDIMTTAAYGGITYWAIEPRPIDFAAAPEGAHTIRDGEEGKVYHLTPEAIRKATVEIAEGKHTNDTIRDYVRSAFDNWTEEDGIDCGDIDADAADCIVQVACFGKVVYG